MNLVDKRQTRHSEIRLSGVPPPLLCTKTKTSKLTLMNTFYRGLPPSTIYKNSKNIERTLFSWAKIKTPTLSKNVKTDPQKYVYQGSGSPPLLDTKTLIKTRCLSKTSKYTLMNTFYRGPPPSTIYKNSKNIERTLFSWAKMKTRALSKNVKIGPQEYVYQGSPPHENVKFILR